MRAGYKQTEAGAIPLDWNMTATADLVEPTAPICYGVVQVGQDTNGGVPIVAIKYVKEITSAPLHRTSVALEQPYSRSRVKGGDVLISVKGTIGRVGIVPEGFVGNISRELARLRPSKSYSGEYIGHQFGTGATQARISRAVVGTTRLEFSIATLRDFQLPIPKSITEQHSIANALSDADALIESLEQLLTKKRHLKQGAMQELLSGRTRLPSFHGVWEVVSLGDILVLVADYTANGSFEALRLNVTYFQDDNYAALVRTTDLERRPFHPERFTDKRGYDFLKKTSLFGGEVVIANVGSVGKAYRVPTFDKPMTLAPNTYLLRFNQDRIDEDYISQWMQSSDFVFKIMEKVGSTTLLAINKDNLRSIVVNCPPLLEQTAIATTLSDMDAEITALEAKLAKTRHLKQGMMQVLLTGQIRLV